MFGRFSPKAANPIQDIEMRVKIGILFMKDLLLNND
jgi:hypothetical protein